jgi:uncharacterized repeat protein (TIGR01451 family)
MERFATKFAALAIASAIAVGCQSTSTTTTTGTPTTAPAPLMTSTPGAGATRSNVAMPAAVQNTGDMIRSSMAFPTGDPKTSAVGLDRAMPAEVIVGKPFEYSYVITNTSANQLDGVKITESVAQNIKLADSVAGVAMRRDGGNVVYDVGTLKPGESKTIKVGATATAAGPLPCCASVAYTSALCMTGVAVAPALKIEKVMPADAMACDNIPMKITVTNTGSGTVRGVRIEDALPEGLTLADGKTSYAADIGNLAAGQSRTVDVMLKATKTGEYKNTAMAKSADGINAESNSTTTAVKKPVLTITKAAPDKIFAGSNFTYTIEVANKGDAVSKATTVVDTLPKGVVASAASDGGQIAPGRATWNLGDLAPGASKKVTLTVRATEMGDARNTVTAQGACADPVSAAASTMVSGIPAILLEVTDDPDPVAKGTETVYTIVVTNQGSAPGTNIKIVGTLDEGMEFVSAGGTVPGKLAGNTVTFDPIASIAPKGKATVTVKVKAVTGGDKRFKIQMTSDQFQRPVNEDESSNFYE